MKKPTIPFALRLNGRTLAQFYIDEIFISGVWQRGYTLKRALIACGYAKDTSCMKCGWNETNKFTGLIPTEVNHIDGNNLNNIPSNLEILCPNCHSLTGTHKGTNTARAKRARAKREKCQSGLMELS